LGYAGGGVVGVDGGGGVDVDGGRLAVVDVAVDVVGGRVVVGGVVGGRVVVGDAVGTGTAPVQAVPLSANEAGAGFWPLHAALKPNDALPFVARFGDQPG
jgi:hypothetical protein